MHKGKQKQMNASYQASLVNRHIRRFTGSALVPYTVEGMGVGTHQRRPLVNRAFGSRDIPKPLKSVTTAGGQDGGPAAHTQDFPLLSVELARPAASLVKSWCKGYRSTVALVFFALW